MTAATVARRPADAAYIKVTVAGPVCPTTGAPAGHTSLREDDPALARVLEAGGAIVRRWAVYATCLVCDEPLYLDGDDRWCTIWKVSADGRRCYGGEELGDHVVDLTSEDL